MTSCSSSKADLRSPSTIGLKSAGTRKSEISRRRDPKRLSQYFCYFCQAQIVWGELFRIIRTDPGQPNFELREIYSHRACMRAVLRPEVPLTLSRSWLGRAPYLDDSDQIDDKPCGICAGDIGSAELTRLRIQFLTKVSGPEFDEESVPVHTSCLRLRMGVS
jgi:hypothetical protein